MQQFRLQNHSVRGTFASMAAHNELQTTKGHAMYTTYEDACEATISRKRAQRAIAEHSGEWEEFVQAAGDKDEYSGQEVLAFLGY